MTGNDHVRFGPGAAGKGPASGHLADGLPVSRAVMAARFGFAEDTIRLAAALRPALASRGIPATSTLLFLISPALWQSAQLPAATTHREGL